MSAKYNGNDTGSKKTQTSEHYTNEAMSASHKQSSSVVHKANPYDKPVLHLQPHPDLSQENKKEHHDKPAKNMDWWKQKEERAAKTYGEWASAMSKKQGSKN